MNEPLVSIIVPCYKQAIFLPETLNSVSILFQKDVSFEIVIADDGSEKNNFEKIRDYLAFYAKAST